MPRCVRVVAPALAALLMLACGTTALRRTTVAPARLQSVRDSAAAQFRDPGTYLKAHLRDGRAYVFDHWSLAGGTVSGTGRVLDANRTQVAQGALALPLDSAVLFESDAVQTASAVGLLTVPTIVTVAIGAMCAANPKACFGSCPTFYASDGTGPLLQAEGFSASVAPALEATDVDALYRVRPEGRRFALLMRNEALETHVVRYVRVLAAPRPPGGHVFATGDGRFLPAPALAAPPRCRAAEGDCGALVAAFDGRERFSPADSFDLAAREEVELWFATPPAGPVGLVVAGRQTLLNTYLFYQGLAYLGTHAGDFIAALERGVPGTREALGAAQRLLGGIDVLVPDSAGGWRIAGTYDETGPLATDVRVIPLPDAGGGPLRVRLRMTKGLWRLDWVALASLGPEVTPWRLAPAEVRRDGAVDETARRTLTDSVAALVAYPGDAYAMTFDLPDDPERFELFVESRGYYLEWMRPEWIAEEELGRAALLVADPARVYRELAPDFKRREPTLERAFWGSRYVRH